MQVSDIRIRKAKDYCQLEALVQVESFHIDPFLLWFRFPARLATSLRPDNGDPFLAALLTPAMALGENLNIEAFVSPLLQRMLAKLQNVYQSWNGHVKPIRVNSSSDVRPAVGSSDRVGLFFSLGVDSFYSLLKNESDHPNDEDTITDLMLVRGFDMRLDRRHDQLFSSVEANVRRVAQQLKKDSLIASTNLRHFNDQFAEWGRTYHGAALASVALALADRFRRVHIAASYDWNHLFPWGSHPELDPLWSTEDMTLIHDGCEATRLEKTRWLREFPLALNSVRVCYKNPDSQYNCGTCRKCLITMIALFVHGALHRCTVFPNDIDERLVREISVPRRSPLYQELVDALDDSEKGRRLKAALQIAIARGQTEDSKETSPLRPAHKWLQERKNAATELASIVGNHDTVLLVDEDKLAGEVREHVRAIPFPSLEGKFGGPPRNSQIAIQELEKQRAAGAAWMAFAWPAFWWLDYYSDMGDHLRAEYRCVIENERLIVFDLKSKSRLRAAGTGTQTRLVGPASTQT